MWRRHKPKPLNEVDRWINEGQSATVEDRLNTIAHQHAGHSEDEVRTALQSARIPAPASVIDGLASRISVLEPAQGTRATVRMRTHDPR
ncbi:protein of unknown function [Microbacterium sp. Nx66]|uniref:hypothetical protein n=1 Tax=Microbacterium sp. Nx66 TaxID=2766784 RepID=UPI0016570429|nr:hypothetical protein [Microbacterium sp. Nx66]CAD5140695.1 protein of unknown function [Microbacterium sp. Nx66]